MRLFRGPALVKIAAANAIGHPTQSRHFFEAHPHFHQSKYPFLPVHFINEPKHNSLPLEKFETLFASIQTTKNNNAAENARLFKQLADIKETEKALTKSHHNAFKTVFYEFTQHWLIIGEKLQENMLFEEFEKCHDELEMALSQESFDKIQLEKALTRIHCFIKNSRLEEKGSDNALIMARSCITLLLKNLKSYVPKIIEQEYTPDKPSNLSCKM
ncbi:MAG: hypothetical protein Q8L78_05730 [Coxiellaceae bacterium]|nr:hypothetical protein [Coxiellaceae bacterium]